MEMFQALGFMVGPVVGGGLFEVQYLPITLPEMYFIRLKYIILKRLKSMTCRYELGGATYGKESLFTESIYLHCSNVF